ncbi:MAG: stage V sporulation protein AD [Clostridiales bacterium]|nr:stage V sporulation protein AD [Clostridiales bacterium]
MAIRQGRYTLALPSRPAITGCAAVVGKKEGEGPLADEFDSVSQDDSLGESSFEKAESAMQRDAVTRALNKAGETPENVDMVFAGDLLNQCIGTSFGLRGMDMPFAGLYGACSTMSLSLALSAVMTDTGAAGTCIASTSSHFCSAERQYRLPLEYGGQRTPTSQWTATAAGAAVIKGGGTGPRITAAIFGKIQDLGIKDANNMGAAMAPAAASTIADFLKDTASAPTDYDMILTGDLGTVGSSLLAELLIKEENIDISGVHSDCGVMLYDIPSQDVHAGGSGCGCSAAVLCSYIMRRIREKQLKRVLFIGTGALLSPTSTLQGESIPAIAHGVLLEADA